MNHLLIKLCLFFSIASASAMQLPQKMKDYIVKSKQKSIQYAFYNTNTNSTIDVNAIIQDMKTAMGESYMGEVEQTDSSGPCLTMFMLGQEKTIKQRLQGKPWFDSKNLIGDSFIDIDDSIDEEK